MPSRPSFFTQALLAVVFVAAVLGALILQEAPTGRVEGIVRSEVTNAPLPRARIVLTNMDEEAPVQVKRIRADKDGRFNLRDVPVGAWELTATTQAHGGKAVTIQVQEGEPTPVQVALERTQPELEVAPIQRTFAPSAKIFVPLRGYTEQKGGPLEIRLYRTRFADLAGDSKLMDALRKTGNRYEPVASIPSELIEKSSFVNRWDVPLTEADGEGFFHQRVPLPVKGPGVYLLQASYGKHSACSWINVTNLALVVKRSKRMVPGKQTGSVQWTAFVSDITTGKPMPAVTVSALSQGWAGGMGGRTGTDGLFRIEAGAANDNSVFLLASGKQGEAILGSNAYMYNEGGGQKVATYTERPIYRPGDTIYYKGIVRRPMSGAYSYSISRQTPVTVELRDTSGERLFRSQTQTNDFGSYWGAVTLSAEAPTGYYSLVTSINGEESTTDVQVAAYRKPEMTVTVKPVRERATSGDTVEMMVDAKYYFGSAVAGGKVSYEVYRETDWRAEYPPEFGYSEDDASFEDDYSGDYYGEYVDDGEAVLDAAGHAVITFKAAKEPDPEATEQQAPPQSEIWTIRARVSDPAEREVEGSGRVQVTAGDFRLGVEPDGSLGAPNQPKDIEFSAVNYETSKPVAGQPVTLEWGLETWDENSGKVNYAPTGNQTVTTGADGKAVAKVSVPESGELRLTATTADKAGRPIEARKYVWIAEEGTGRSVRASADELSVLTDKRRYERGETARILINASNPAQAALLTIEGQQLYKAWTIPLKGASTEVKVPLPAAYGPNVTFGVCYVRDGAFQQSQAALRVEVPEREVQVTVVPDQPKHEPGEKVSYTVTTKNAAGKLIPAEFSLAVVDEAIYALRSDDPTLLRDTFYPRSYNSVETQNSLAVEYLGDANKAAPDIKARRRFVDTAFWLPDGHTDASGTTKISFNLPDNLTEWRATVLAQTQDSAFGRATTPVVSAKPFMVRLDKPRFAVEGDVLRLTGTVHNDTGAVQQASVRLDSADVTTSDDLTQTVTLQPGEEKPVEWRVTPGATDATLKVSAWTQDQKFTDAVEQTLEVRPYGREEVETVSGSLGASKAVTFTVDGKPDRTRVRLRLTAGPLDAFSGSFEYLLGFPYGCVEQTASRMFPDLLAERLLKITGRKDLIKAETAAQLPVMARDGIVRLTSMQHPEGNWGWWNYDSADAFLTGYALQTLALAKAQGYSVPQDSLNRGAEAALKFAATQPQQEPKEKKEAYEQRREEWLQSRPGLLLAAASAGQVDKAAAARDTLDLKTLDSPALANTALLDRVLPGGRRDAYDALMAKGSDDGALFFWTSKAPTWQSDYDAINTSALGLRAMLAYEPQSPLAPQVIRFLMSRRTGDFWQSTRDTATVLHALVDYVAVHPESSAASGTITIQVNGNTWRTVDLEDRRALKLLDVPASMLKEGENQLLLQGGSGFYSVDNRHTAAPAAGTTLTPLSIKGVKVMREFFRPLPLKAGSLRPPLEPLNGRAKQGEPITIRLTIESPQDLAYLMVEDTFPAGCEPTQLGTADVSSGEDWDYWWDATEVRDDRIAFFAHTLTKGKHVIEYSLRAQTPGEYRVLPTLAMPMYAPEIRAETGEGKLVIE